MATAIWFVAHNYTPADANSIQAVVPENGTYADLNTGDMCMVYNNGQIDMLSYDSTSSATQNIPSIITPDGNAGNGRWLKKEFSQHNKNGFAVMQGPQPDTLATIGVVGTTFTITFVAEYSFYVLGVKYTVTSGNHTVEITDVEGTHWVYFDNTGTLQIVDPNNADTHTLIFDTCLVAGVQWDSTNNVAILVPDERHGAGMSPVTHLYLHDVYGAVFETGFGFTGFSVDGSGNAAASAQFDVEAGEMHDEDNEFGYATDTDATIPTFYKSGVGGNWRRLEATATYPVADGTVGGRLDWNDYNGGDWRLQEVSNNGFVCTHYFATNDPNTPIIGVMGETVYANANQARTGAETEILDITYLGLPLVEFIILGSVIWQTSDSYTNQVAARIISTDEGDDYIDWRQVRSVNTGGGATSDHEALDNLLGGAAGDHYHLTGTQETDLTDGGESTLHYHNSLKDGGEVGAVYANGAAAELKYNAVTTCFTHASGFNIRDSLGTNPTLFFQNSSGTNLCLFAQYLGDFWIQNYETSGHVLFQCDDSGGNVKTAIDASAVNVELNTAGLLAMQTTAEGIDIQDTSGTSPIAMFRDSSANDLGLIMSYSDHMYMQNFVNSGHCILRGEDSGGVATDMVTADPDDAVTIQWDGRTSIYTASRGLVVRDASSDTGARPSLTLEDTDGTDRMILVAPGASTMYIQNKVNGGDLWLSAQDSSGSIIWAGIDVSNPAFIPAPADDMNLGTTAAKWKYVWAVYGTIQTSDGSLKDKIDDGLGMDFVNRIDSMTYKFTASSGRHHQGFDARQVKDVITAQGRDFGGFIDPKVNDPEDTTSSLMLNYSEFIPPLYNAMSELDVRVHMLNDRRISNEATVQQQMIELSNRIKDLEDQLRTTIKS